MTTAMVKTVEQYCQPIRPRLKRPFSETHITRTIRAQRLSDAGAYEAEEGLRDDAKEDAHGEFAVVEEELYVPTSTDTKLALAKLTIFVTRILSQADGGDGPDGGGKFAMDNLAEAAANAVVHALKDPLPSAADKHHHVNEICGVAVSQAQVDDMLKLVDKLHDYVPPLDASESTTLNTTGEHAAGPPAGGDGEAPAPKYPDPEQITEATLTQHMYTGADLPPLELLVRTSGVERLSDFMLWQCHQTTEIAFVKCFWPDFGLIHLIPIILEYQWRKKRESYWGEAVPGWTKID
jgi:Putative undecaprenyl diphosphate synthase